MASRRGGKPKAQVIWSIWAPMEIAETITAKIGVSGTLVFKDKDGNVVAEAPFTAQVTEEQPEQSDGDQRSE